MLNAEMKMSKARSGLILDQPFWGSLAMRLGIEAAKPKVKNPEKPRKWIMQVNGKVIKYDVDRVMELSLDEVKGVICHEVMHCALQHHLRRGDREPGKWNRADDYAINPILLDAKMTLPPGLWDDTYRGMSAEEIYTRIPDGTDNDDDDDDDGDGDARDWGEVEDATDDDGNPAGESEKSQQGEDWKVALAQAATQAKQAGTLPAGLERLVQEILEPKLDWREMLKRFVDTTARNDYRWTPPNRRHIHAGLYLPSLRSEELENITVAIDTSGSISGEQINDFASEMTGMLSQYRAHCTVIYCDAAVARVEEFEPEDLPLALHPAGGGGTDFRPPFAEVEKRGGDPKCFIYMTDGECSSFPDQPNYPVLWIVKPYGDRQDFKPPFGEVAYF